MRRFLIFLLFAIPALAQPGQPGTALKPPCTLTRTVNCTPQANAAGVMLPVGAASTVAGKPLCAGSVTTDCIKPLDANGNLAIGTRVLPDGVFDVRAYGAKGDERTVTDAAITAGSATLTSATAAFSAADNARTFTVFAGAQTMKSGTYTSGGSISGVKDQSCTLTAFNGAANVAATVYLTGTNTIASGTFLFFSNVGAALTTAPISATLGNGDVGTGTVNTADTVVSWVSGTEFPKNWVGSAITINSVAYTVSTVLGPRRLLIATTAGTQTGVAFSGLSATCSGTATIATVLQPAPITTTGTVTNATTVTLGVPATTSVSGAILRVGTDDSVAFQSAFNAAVVRGGDVYAPAAPGCPVGVSPCAYLLLDHIVPPAAGSAVTDGIPPRMAAIRFRGDGPSFTTPAGTQALPPMGGTILDLRYNSTGPAAIDVRGSGSWEMDHLTLWNGGNATVPMLQVTNPVVHLHDNMWIGAGDGTYGTTNQDGIVLGGTGGGGNTTIDVNGGPTAPFYGLGSVVESNGFDRLRRGIWGRGYVNQITIGHNYWYCRNGGDATSGLLDIDAYNAQIGPEGARVGITENWFDNIYAVYSIKLTKAFGCTISGSQFWDAGPRSAYDIRFDSPSYSNVVIAAQKARVSDSSTGNGLAYSCVPNATGWCFDASPIMGTAITANSQGGVAFQGRETTGNALAGDASAGRGVYGTSATGTGVMGSASTSGAGVYGSSATGTAVYGTIGTSGKSIHGVNAGGTESYVIYGSASSNAQLINVGGVYGYFKIDHGNHLWLWGGTAPTITPCGTGSSITGTDSYGSITTAGTLTDCKVNFNQWFDGGTPRYLQVFVRATGALAPITAADNKGFTFTATTGTTYTYLAFQ